MPRTIPASFTQFKASLEITDLQTETVSTRHSNVRSAVEGSLKVIDSFLSGSYARQTLIAPLNQADVDIVLILDPEYFHNYDGQNGGQSGLLDLLKRTLKKTYPNTPDISRNGQAVTIRFTDFAVDVVPAFHRNGGGFLIPNSITQTWLPTDPKQHVTIWSAANKAHNGDLVPLIKMLKAWNRASGAFLRSFHLEAITLQILNNVTISDFSSGTRYVLDKGREYITKKNPDPAGYGDDVGGYLNGEEKIKAAAMKFESSFARAQRAEDHERRGNIEGAVDLWRLIFGDYFPAFG